jgi:hypothetical protein
MSDGDQTVEIKIFVAAEECVRCGHVVMVAVRVAEDAAVCKGCFDDLYQVAIKCRKEQIRCN